MAATLTWERVTPQAASDAADLAEMLATPFADVVPVEAEYVWRNRVPVGELTILAALGGTGKGMLTVDLAARISRGDPLPGEDEGQPPGNVVMISAEDDANVVTVNRLQAAGADMSRVYDLSTVGGALFELPAHLGILRQAIAAIGGVRLVILDPLAGVAPVSLTAVARVRSVLSPLRQLAQDTGCAILITHHLTKGREIAGSRAVVDGVRSVLMVNRSEADEEIRVVSIYKTNMGASDADIRYKVVPAPDGEQAVVEYVTDAEEKPQSGQDKIMAALKEAARPMSGQEIAARTGIAYSTARVLLARLIASGRAVSPQRGWFSAAGVTTAGQGVTPLSGVAAST